MKNRHILSPMAKGNGAHVIHCQLEKNISGYDVISYNPYWTLLPFTLPVIVSCQKAHLIHSTPDYAIFHHSRKLPLIITFHNYVLDQWMRSYSSMLQQIHYATDLRLWTMLAVKKAKHITAVSHFIADLIAKDLNLAKPVRVIYNGINVEKFKPQLKTNSEKKEIKVFFSGNLTRRKGAQWLPAIANNLSRNVHICYTEGLRAQNSFSSHKKLHPVGRIPFDDMPNLYNKMDMLVMPTVREGFGLAVAEAMACGLPVVASNCSSIPELIDNGKGGFLCPVGDINEFAEKINLLAESPAIRREMGEYNRVKVEKMFSLDRMVKEYDDLFKEALS